jgi:peptide/nickel transport system substrate-binding protein
MRPTGWQYLAVVSALALGSAPAATRPRYGGVLRVEMRERLASFDGSTRIASLIFDSLVRMDDEGRPRPSLALSWQSDAEQKRWEFRLRSGVKFHDGYPMTPATVAGVLQRLMGAAATVTASAESVVVKFDRPMPGLPAELARPAAAMIARGPDGSPVGTGPFRVARFEPGRHLSLAAFDDHWNGRPFLDAVEIEMGRPTRDQLVDLQIGKADLIELAPNEMRTATDRGARTWISAPVELIALAFGPARGSGDARLREALALAIDRNAIHNVLLQRQGVVTGALLPQWLSGYAFLFPPSMDLPRARQLVAEVPVADRTLPLSYDLGDPLARILADRIAVNARDAGITLQVTNQPRAELRLARVRLDSLDGALALSELAATFGLGEVHVQNRPDAIYAAERALLDGQRLVPLFHLPDACAVGPRVRIWQRPGIGRLGALRLADIWMGPEP